MSAAFDRRFARIADVNGVLEGRRRTQDASDAAHASVPVLKALLGSVDRIVPGRSWRIARRRSYPNRNQLNYLCLVSGPFDWMDSTIRTSIALLIQSSGIDPAGSIDRSCPSLMISIAPPSPKFIASNHWALNRSSYLFSYQLATDPAGMLNRSYPFLIGSFTYCTLLHIWRWSNHRSRDDFVNWAVSDRSCGIDWVAFFPFQMVNCGDGGKWHYFSWNFDYLWASILKDWLLRAWLKASILQERVRHFGIERPAVPTIKTTSSMTIFRASRMKDPEGFFQDSLGDGNDPERSPAVLSGSSWTDGHFQSIAMQRGNTRNQDRFRKPSINNHLSINLSINQSINQSINPS